MSVVSRLSSAADRMILGSSPSFTTMTFFWHFSHQRSPFLSLNKGEAHAGQARFVRVDPCLSRSAIRLTCESSFAFRDKL